MRCPSFAAKFSLTAFSIRSVDRVHQKLGLLGLRQQEQAGLGSAFGGPIATRFLSAHTILLHVALLEV